MGMQSAGVTFASLMGLGPQAAVADGPAGRVGRVLVVLGGRDHRAGGVLPARRRRGRRARARPRHRRPGPAAAHADGGGHGRRHAPGARTPSATSSSASASPRPSSPSAGTACPTATGRVARTREYVDAGAGLPVRREGRLRRRLLHREGLPPRREAGRAPTEDRRRRAQPGDAADWPASSPTASCSTTCRRRTCRGRSSRSAPAGDGRRSTPTSTPASATARTASSWPGGTCSPTPSSTPTPATSSGPASATRSPRSASAHAAGDRDGALAAVSDRMVDAIDVMGDADTVRGHDARLRGRRRRRAGAHAAALGRRPSRHRPTQAIRAARRAGVAVELAGKVALVTGGGQRDRSGAVRAVRRRGRPRGRRGRPRAGRRPRSWPTASAGSGLALAADVGVEAEVGAAVAATEAPLRPDRPARVQRRHRLDAGPRRARRAVAAGLGRQRHGPRLRRQGRGAGHGGARRRVHPDDRLRSRSPRPDRRRAVQRDEARGGRLRRVAVDHVRRRRDPCVLPVPAGRQHRPAAHGRPRASPAPWSWRRARSSPPTSPTR